MKITPYLSFDGDCAAAFKFYEKVLNGKITLMMTWGESQAAGEVPPQAHNLIMHVTLTIGDVILMGADAMPGSYERPQGISVSLQIEKTSEGNRIFTSLSESGSIKLPFQPTFWSPGFGMCVDQFGIPWLINCEAESDVSQ